MSKRPAFRIQVNGTDWAGAMVARVKSVSVTDAAGLESDTVEVVLADDDRHHVELPPPGAELRVWLGYEGQLQDMGLFVVDEVEAEGWPAQLTIRGRAAPYEASKGGKLDLQTQKTRAWPKGTTLGAIVAKIAKEHGMQPAVAPGLASIALPHFDQVSESDISFLVRVTRTLGAVVKPGAGSLVVVKRGEAKTANGKPLPAVTIAAQDCTRWSVNISKRDTEGTVVAYYHDMGAAKRQHVQVGSGDPVRQLRHSYADEASAKRAAQAELDRRDRRSNALSLSAVGNEKLTAEARLVLAGFRAGTPTTWVVSRVAHRFDTARGYSCELEAETPK
jgi:phage protein D